MSQFATPELDGNLNSIAFFQELDGPPNLCIEVSHADFRLETHFLEGDGALLSLRLLLTFGQFVLVLTKVEESRHGGNSKRCDFHQVEPPLLRKPQGVGRSHDTQLATVFIDDPKLEDTDHLIDAQVSANGEPLLYVFRLPAFGGFWAPKADERPYAAHDCTGRSPAGLYHRDFGGGKRPGQAVQPRFRSLSCVGYGRRAAVSSASRSTKADQATPFSCSPARLRMATVRASISRSPRTSMYGTFCS